MLPGKAAFTHVVFPVPLGPNKKKLLPFGGDINLEYITPFCIYIWKQKGDFSYSQHRFLILGNGGIAGEEQH
jgi:hypothetical protein